MPYSNTYFGETLRNALVKSLYVQNFTVAGSPLPPGTQRMITENSDVMITESGDTMITE